MIVSYMLFKYTYCTIKQHTKLTHEFLQNILMTSFMASKEILTVLVRQIIASISWEFKYPSPHTPTHTLTLWKVVCPGFKP